MAQNDDFSRRDVMKLAGGASLAAAAATTASKVGGPAVISARADSKEIRYSMIGTGSRGAYLLSHLTKVDNGHCAALCDLNQEALDKAATTIGTNPKKYKDY